MTAGSTFLLNLLLALTWATATGEFTFRGLLAGFVVAYLVLAVARPVIGASGYFVKVRQALELAAFFVWELVVASLEVAHDVVTPTHRSRPGVMGIPLDAKTDAEITILANLISLTPGTLSLDVSEDRRMLYIHAMFIHDPERLRRRIKDGLERRVLELLR